MMRKIHIAKDNEYIYYMLDGEMDVSDINIKKQAIIDVTEEELGHILALGEIRRADYLEKKLDNE